MPESTKPEPGSLIGVLHDGVRALRTEPPLLAAVLVTIVLLLVAVWAPGSVAIVAWPLVAILGVGTIAWLVHDVGAARSGRPRFSQRVSFGMFNRIGGNVTIGGQNMDADDSPAPPTERTERRG